MGGLALGYHLFGKIADKGRSALNLYGWMEIGIGLCGLLFVPLLGWLGSFYISLVGHFGLDSILASAFKFALSILLLLIPTVLMGGTLPVLSRFVVRSLGHVERKVAWLYFLNSFGAVVGSLLAGFVLIPQFGLNLSIAAAVILNLLVGLIALTLRPWEKRDTEGATSQTIPESGPTRLYSPGQIRIAIIGIALSGGAALTYEIAWIRLLSLVLGSSTYSFSLMLAAFIAGIATGSFIVSKKWVLRFDPYLLFGFAELGIALSIVLTLPLYERLPFYFAVLSNVFVRVPQTFWLYELTKFFVCFLLMLLPTLFLGMTLPLVSQVAARSLKKLGENIGNVFAANTAGTLTGAVAAGLVFLPLLGIKRLIEAGVMINLVVGTSALWVGPYLRLTRKNLALGTSFALFALYLYLFPAWDKNLLSSGTFRLRGFYAGISYREFKKGWQDEILYYKDGAKMTVAITKAKDDQIILRVNGKPDASSRTDLPTQILLGQIPLLLKPDARNVLVIGLGSGITAGSVLRHPVERLDLVEISPEVVEGSRFFSQYNHDALKDPRLRLHIEDGKTFLKVTPDRYDIIISEPSNPWIAGIGNLFTVEFYRDIRERIKPDGLMVQWIHAYEMTDETLKLLLRTFTLSFEHVTLWNPAATDLVLIGSRAAFSVNFQESLARFQNAKVKEELGRLGIESFATVLSLQLASDEGVRRAAGKGRLNEDLFPILEYEAPKAFFLGEVSQFLISYDERLRPRDRSPLYFAEHLKKRPLSQEEIKNIAIYHLTYRSLSPSLAQAFLAMWLRKAPDDLAAHMASARIEESRGDIEAARRKLQYLLKAHPNNPQYLETAARLEFRAYLNQRSLLDSKSPKMALTYLHRLVELGGTKKDGVYRKIAQIHATGRDYKSALEYLEKAALYAQKNKGEFQADSLWLEAAGMALETEDTNAALAYVQKALMHNPENGLAKKMLRQLSQ
jgi:predicted membrane-bound spermidine synthase/Tfp pilus assembly protein PilF